MPAKKKKGILRKLQERIDERRDVTQTSQSNVNTRRLMEQLDAIERGERPKQRKRKR